MSSKTLVGSAVFLVLILVVVVAMMGDLFNSSAAQEEVSQPQMSQAQLDAYVNQHGYAPTAIPAGALKQVQPTRLPASVDLSPRAGSTTAAAGKTNDSSTLGYKLLVAVVKMIEGKKAGDAPNISKEQSALGSSSIFDKITMLSGDKKLNEMIAGNSLSDSDREQIAELSGGKSPEELVVEFCKNIHSPDFYDMKESLTKQSQSNPGQQRSISSMLQLWEFLGGLCP